MPVRPATYWDLVPSSRILAAAFRDDGLSQYLNPWQSQYPDDASISWLRSLRASFYDGPDTAILVSYETTSDGKEKITGYAHWVRRRQVHRKRSVYQWFMSQIMKAYNYLESFVIVNRAADPERQNVVGKLDPILNLALGDLKEYWYLQLLGVHPEAQRSGQGRQLLSYGVDRAKIEDVPAGLVASKVGQGFYQRCGFDVMLGWLSDVKFPDNPFEKIGGGGAIMFTRRP